MYNTEEGPRTITIPATVVLSCSMCKYFRRGGLIKSGFNPIYSYYCEHLDAPFKGSLHGNLESNELNIIETPEWCPFLNIQKDNGKV